MRSQVPWVLIGVVTALCAGAAQADIAVCNTFGWRRGANTTCVTRPSTTRPAHIVRGGKLYFWSPRARTY
jgi:hypothetical protein